MDIWVAVAIEFVCEQYADPRCMGEPVPIEAFLTKEECWAFIHDRSDRAAQIRHDRVEYKLNVIYVHECRRHPSAQQ